MDFKEIEISNDRFSLTLEHIGEGISGDYDEDDTNDIPLLRFTLLEKVGGEWENVNDGSFCTLLDARKDHKQLETAAKGMLKYITENSNDEINEQALQLMSYAELVKGKIKLPKVK